MSVTKVAGVIRRGSKLRIADCGKGPFTHYWVSTCGISLSQEEWEAVLDQEDLEILAFRNVSLNRIEFSFENFVNITTLLLLGTRSVLSDAQLRSLVRAAPNLEKFCADVRHNDAASVTLCEFIAGHRLTVLGTTFEDDLGGCCHQNAIVSAAVRSPAMKMLIFPLLESGDITGSARGLSGYQQLVDGVDRTEMCELPVLFRGGKMVIFGKNGTVTAGDYDAADGCSDTVFRNAVDLQYYRE